MFGGAIIQYSSMNNSLRSSKLQKFRNSVSSSLPAGSLRDWFWRRIIMGTTIFKNRNSSRPSGIPSFPLISTKPIGGLQSLLESHPESHYTNDTSLLMVRTANGRYLNQARNIFLSSKIMLLGNERNTLNLDLVAIVLISLVISMLTWVKLRFFYN